ncbi:hypothetical protein [Vibrio sp. HN007]|uniref:hypothetical protein n=1 Tax=Vibrio iocasae TaxID=3098914 RepID=UPI0035D40AA7
MNSVYKIETSSASSATMVYRFIQSHGGECLRRGSAVITDYTFNRGYPPSLISHISLISDQLTGNDYQRWALR